MKNYAGFILVLAWGLYSGAQVATSNSVSLTSGSIAAPLNQLRKVIKQEKIEDPNIITDQVLRADEGSFKRYSLKSSLSYSGPGIGDLSNKNQPNPDGVPSNNQTKITGSLSARYRIDGVSAMSLGTGLAANHPFHGMDRTDVNSPYLSYDRSSRFDNLQLRQSFSGSYVTTPEFTNLGEVATASYSLDSVYNLGDSRWAVGFDSSLSYFIYNRAYKLQDNHKASQYYLSFYPNLKYVISDKININTSFAYMFYNPRRIESRWNLQNRTVTQRIGMGYSFRRDVYFSPYLTIYPDNMKTANTTFNLAATFSVL